MNPRKTKGAVEGEPGETIFVSLTDILPPKIIIAQVQDDGYFADEVYDEVDRLRRDYMRSRMRDDDDDE